MTKLVTIDYTLRAIMMYNISSRSPGMIKIGLEAIDRVSVAAKNSARLRANMNYHKSYDESVQRLLNAIEPGTYVRPHKHENPDKVEVFILLKGKAMAIEYDDAGSIVDTTLLEISSIRGVEISPRTWHSFIALEKGTVLYEIKEGPFQATLDKNFALWAPREEDRDAAQQFIHNTLKDIEKKRGCQS
jgi:cupin fold WbuC family metalloprotein